MGAPGALQVIATAGHVDHGKSSLIARLTGIDPDRWAEEKRRGLTIDLGFAWATLPSGQEVGFVDVPGHERFLRNMLAGVGPVRLVLFVVAADEGWKPQSEEHLGIVDVLGAHGGVVALTKSDLAQGRLAQRAEEVRAQLAATVLADAPIVPCSSATDDGLGELMTRLDELVAGAPGDGGDPRPRLAVDRSFSIAGAGTVVTGTLTGGPLRAGMEAQLLPAGGTARIRSLQTHRRSVEVALPVSRVAANLAGASRDAVERGDVLAVPGQWRPTAELDVRIVPVRTLAHALTHRGAYKLYLGSAERDARLRFLEPSKLEPGSTALARLRITRPVVAAPHDRFVLREAGRRETVAGGLVLDPHPPRKPSIEALQRREASDPDRLPSLVVNEMGTVRVSELPVLAGRSPERVDGARRLGEIWVSDEAFGETARRIREALEQHHGTHPLSSGLDLITLRSLVGEPRLTTSVLDEVVRSGEVVREGSTVRLAGHAIDLGAREGDAARLLAEIAAGGAAPPVIAELLSRGHDAELIDAVCATGRLLRVSAEIVVLPELARRAQETATALGSGGADITVSAFRQALGTTRKYALPLLAWLDSNGVTVRAGEARRLAG